MRAVLSTPLFRKLSFHLAGAALLLAASGCDSTFEPKTSLTTLRIIGVRADNPYPKPGDAVQLEMLWHDGASPVNAPRKVQVMWIGGCFNPVGDLYYQCFPQMAKSLAQLEKDPSKAGDFIGFGNTFTWKIPSDLISSKPPLEGVVPYGLSYVFFAACAGELRPAEPGPDNLPIGCFAPDGTRLGADDFVPGYFALYSYNDRSNTNPVFRGLEINGQLLDPQVEAVYPKCLSSPCADLRLRSDVDPASAEQNEVAPGKFVQEQMWVEYFATAGEFDDGAQLVNDATKGFNADNGVIYTPPEGALQVVFYAVVRDNRGGVAWVKQPVRFE